MRILLADDDVFSRTLLSSTLRRLGHDTVAVANGQEAIDAYRNRYFPMVISDWMMPELDGLDLCRLIRAEENPKYTYIMLLTVMEGTQSHLDGLAAGADDFITKPFNEDVLIARILVGERIVNMHNVNRKLAQLIPICSYCKKARNDSDYWQRMDDFLLQQTSRQLTHGICPECLRTRCGLRLSS
jgi:DNA-binding response OmpR family regulator